MQALINLFNAIFTATESAREKAEEIASTITNMKKLNFTVSKADKAKQVKADRAVQSADAVARKDFDAEICKWVKACKTADLPDFFRDIHIAFVTNANFANASQASKAREDYLKPTDNPPTFSKVSCRAIAAFGLQNGLDKEAVLQACESAGVTPSESLLIKGEGRYLTFPGDNLARENMAGKWKQNGTFEKVKSYFAN